MRPSLTPWGLQEEKCVFWKVSVGLKCVRMSRIPWLWNLLSQYWLEIETSFFPAAWGRQLSDKVNKFAPSMMEIHTHVQWIYSEWNQHIPPLKSRTRNWNLKPWMRVTPLPIFGAKCKWKLFKRDKSTSRDFVARGGPLRGQKKLAPLAKRSTCSKSRVWIFQHVLSVSFRRMERLMIVSGTNVDLHLRRTKLIYLKICMITDL